MKVSSVDQTVELASRLASQLSKGDVICLYGDLGVGKSVMARAIIRTLCDDMQMDVPSPSFTLIQSYDMVIGSIAHIDAYRLSSADELYELGIPESFETDITIIEWAERFTELTPSRRIDIKIVDDGGDDRTINIEFIGEWAWQI